MQGIKNPIDVGTEVVCLYGQFLMRGVCTKVNAKTYSVEVPAQRFLEAFRKNFHHDRVVNVNDICAVVWATHRGPEGAYRFDHDNYPQDNGPLSKWHQPYTYIVERSPLQAPQPTKKKLSL